ncbi:hypothetical protein IT408_01995 [Candidatus Uhrbacteria bacterium]|nr:hypothetical protein [Candidatus Uhrbacteria bacterium]
MHDDKKVILCVFLSWDSQREEVIMVPVRQKKSRHRLEESLMRLSTSSSAKHFVPFALANMEKWRALIDGKRSNFFPHIVTEEDVSRLPERKIPFSRMYLFGKIIERNFFHVWWREIAPKCANQSQAKAAWSYCSNHLYHLFDIVTRGGSEQDVRCLVNILENCLEE